MSQTRLFRHPNKIERTYATEYNQVGDWPCGKKRAAKRVIQSVFSTC